MVWFDLQDIAFCMIVIEAVDQLVGSETRIGIECWTKGMPLNRTRVVRISASDWRLLIAASVAQVLIAFALRIMPLPTIRARAARLGSLAHFTLWGPEERVIWAIEATGRRLAGVSTCLVRAIVAELALAHPERPLRLTIGVRRDLVGDLHAHAWVADEDRILIGGAMSPEYVELPAIRLTSRSL